MRYIIHVTFFVEFECNDAAIFKVDKLIALRNKINENNNFKISFNDILVKALALAMQKNSQTNVSWIDDKIYQYSSIDVSVAVALEDGLISPIVNNTNESG